MSRWLFVLAMLLLLASGCADAAGTVATPAAPPPAPAAAAPTLDLPRPRLEGRVSVEEALLKRRSVRQYARSPLTLEEASQLLWAAQGITGQPGVRTAPSAGALYPLEVYIAAGDVTGLATGVYRYVPDGHRLAKVRDDDVRAPLAAASAGQMWIADAPVVVVIAAVYERTTGKYGDRGVTYVHMEAGHAAQNLCLQATALDLGATTVGAFFDDRVREVMGMAANEVPVYVIPVGRKP